MNTTIFNEKRFYLLIKVLEELTDDQFNMDHWKFTRINLHNECKTTGCVAGWYCTKISEKLRDIRLVKIIGTYGFVFDLESKIDPDISGEDMLRLEFGISPYYIRKLFFAKGNATLFQQLELAKSIWKKYTGNEYISNGKSDMYVEPKSLANISNVVEYVA